MRVLEAVRKETASRALWMSGRQVSLLAKGQLPSPHPQRSCCSRRRKSTLAVATWNLGSLLREKVPLYTELFSPEESWETATNSSRKAAWFAISWHARHSDLAWQLSSAFRHLVEDQERGKDSRSVGFHNAAVQQHLIQNDVDFIQIKHYLGYIKEISLRI